MVVLYAFVVLIIVIFSIVSMTVPVASIYNDEGVRSDTMKICKDQACPQFGAVLLLFFIALFIFMIFNRVLPKIGFCVILIICLSAFVYVNATGHQSFDDNFEIAKFYLIVLASLALSGSRIWGIYKNEINFSKWWSLILYLILVVNILSAIGTEAKSGYIINPIVGILLILMLPNGFTEKWSDLLYVDKGGNRDLVYKISMAWVIIYSLWDMNYVYSDGREHFASVVVVLLTALLTGSESSIFGIDPGLYIQARTYTLLFRYLILAFGDVFEKYSDSRGMYDDKVKTSWNWVNLIITILAILFNFM